MLFANAVFNVFTGVFDCTNFVPICIICLIYYSHQAIAADLDQ